jgi:hypothetical protein
MPIYIDDAIAKLQEIKAKEGNLECCKVGHYGEINEMSTYDIGVYRNAQESAFKEGKTRPVVDFCVPDIGPDPD